jgi:hypothetical protein
MKTFCFKFGKLVVVVAEENEVDAQKIATKLAEDRHANTAQKFDPNPLFSVELPKGGTAAWWV